MELPISAYEAKKMERQAERVKRSVQVLESYATGLTLRSVKVKTVKGTGSPAFSDSANIWIDESQLGDLTTVAGVASLKGLTLHEIAHILLTPRDGSELLQWVTEEDLFSAYNSLEDQRIETLLSAQFPPIRDWLTYTITQYLLSNEETLDRAFPLIRGRKYLDPKVRRAIKEAFVNQHDVAELSSIIDQYRLLNLSRPAEQELAKPLIKRYNELVESIQPPTQNEPGGQQGESGDTTCGGWQVMPDPNGHNKRSSNEHDTNVHSRPLSPKEQERIIDRAKAEEPEDVTDIDEDEEDASTTGEGQGESESETTSDNKDTDSDIEGASQPDADGGTSAGAGNEDAIRNIKDILNDVLDEVTERLEDQIATDIELYSGEAYLEGEEVPEPQRASAGNRNPSVEAVVASENFGAELRRLRSEQDPAWARRVDSGRISALRWERGCEIDEAFDQMRSGRADAVDIECVILLDNSGSMDYQASKAYEAMWAIKNALDSVQAATTVVVYSDYAQLLYSADQQVGVQYQHAGCNGGTDPIRALQYAKYLLANSKRSVKLLINITDGVWSQPEKSEAIISDLRNGNVLTALAFISPYDQRGAIDAHGCEVGVHIKDASDLFRLANHLVDVGVARNLAH